MADPRSKGRMLNKSISDSDKFASLSPEAAALFCMLVPHYTPYGKMNGGAGYIKDEVCPKVLYLSYEKIPALLQEISDKTNVKWFKYNGRHWIHSTSFLSEHQKLDKNKCGADLLPSYSNGSPEEVQDFKRTTPELVSRKEEVEVKEEVKEDLKPCDEVSKTETSSSASQSLSVISKDGIKKIEIIKNPNVKRFIDYTYQSFKDKYGIALHIDGKKDGTLVKSLLGTYPIETLEALWDEYMRRYEGEEDEFLQRAGISIGVFKSQVNKLVLKPPPKINNGSVGGVARSVLEKRWEDGVYDKS